MISEVKTRHWYTQSIQNHKTHHTVYRYEHATKVLLPQASANQTSNQKVCE